MDNSHILATLSLAFGLGLLHALDADHIMAVSGLAARRPSLRNSLRFCVRWAIGHGLTLLLIGGAVLLLGMAIPERLSAAAESLVGVILIAIGLWVLWDLHRSRTHLHFHDHDDLPPHAHWHEHTQPAAHAHDTDEHQHPHNAVLVGVLHGTAGSAPLLALIPLSSMGHSPWLGMAYLALFGLGVLLAMFLFGGLLGSTFGWLSRWGNSALRATRAGVALSSIGFGAYLLQTLFIPGVLS
jgi:ABC-type nickel/cobalt efflux system permease component RcnA